MANSRVLLGVSFLGTTLAAVVALFWFWNKKPGERRSTNDEARSRATDRSHVVNSVPSTSRGSSDTSTLHVTTRVDGISGGAGAPSNGCRQKLVDRDIVQGNETCLTEGIAQAERSSSVQSTCTTNQSTTVPQERTAVLCSVKGIDPSNCEADLQPEVVAQTTYSQPSVLSTVFGVSLPIECQQNLSDSGIEQIIASDEQSEDELDMPDVGVCRNRDIRQNVQSNLAVSESEHSGLVNNTAAKTVVDVIVHESIERQTFDPTQQEIVRSTENSDQVPESEQCTVHVCLGKQDESSSAKTAHKSAESVKGTDLALSQPLNDRTSGHGEISLALSVNVAASSMDFSDHEDILSEDSDSESSENEPVEANEVLEVERSNFLSEASCTDDNKAKIEYDIEVESTNKTACLNVAAKDTSASLLTSRNTPDLSASNLIKAESISADSLEGFTEKENYSDNTQSNSKISDDILKIDESEHCVETSEDCKVLASKPGGVNISMDEGDVMSIEENSERCDLEDSVVVVECASREPSQSTESGLSRDSLEPPDSLTGLLPATEVDTDNVAEEEDVPVTPTEVNSRSETVPNPERGDAPHVNGDNTSEASNDSGKGASLVEVAQPAYPPDVQIYQIDFPTELCGRLIGRHGKNIISIKQKSGSNISLRSNPFTSDYQICSIEGLPHEIEEALAIMRERFPKSRYPNLQLDPTTAQNEQPVVMPDLQMTLPPCVSVDVIVSSVANGGLVFLQQPTHPTFPSLERLSQFMLACYTQDRSIPQLPRPVEAGVICAAPMSSGWYRAVVVDMSEDGEECDVKFMDYGGYSRLSVAELRQIRSDFMTLPFQAVECYMGNLTPVQGELTFGAECASILEELTQGKLLQAQVVGRAGDGIPFVHIYQVSGNKALFVNREMVNRGVAQWIEQL